MDPTNAKSHYWGKPILETDSKRGGAQTKDKIRDASSTESTKEGPTQNESWRSKGQLITRPETIPARETHGNIQSHLNFEHKQGRIRAYLVAIDPGLCTLSCGNHHTDFRGSRQAQ